MATTLEELAIHFTADGDSAVSQSLQNVSRATAQTREKVGQELEEMSVITERTANRLEHVAVSGSFAFASLATGTEQGVTRFAHSAAIFGGVFGPMGLAISVFVAVAGEKLIQWFHKASEEAQKAAEKVKTEVANMANAGAWEQLNSKARDIWQGTPFDEKGNLTGPSAGVRGAFEGSLADLRNKMDFFKSQLKSGGDLATDVENQPWLKLIRELQPKLDKVEESFRRINTAMDVMRNRPAEMNVLPMKSTAQSTLTPEEARKRQKEIDKARYETAMEAAKKNYDDEVRLTDDRLARLKKGDRDDQIAYEELLRRRAQLDVDFDEKAKAMKKQLAEEFKKSAEQQLKQDLVDANVNLAQQVEAYTKYAQRIGNIYGQQSEEYAAALLERTKIFDEYLKQTEELERQHQQRMDQQAKEAATKAKHYEEENRRMAKQTADMITQTYQEAFGEGGGIGKAAKDLGATLLKHMGEVFIEQSGIYDVYGAIMQSLSGLLTNPFTAGAGALAIGVALAALGSALGASAKSSSVGGGGGGGVGYASPVSFGFVNPVLPPTSSGGANTAGLAPVPGFTLNATIIGKDDPEAQRQLLEMVARGQRRGSTSG